MSKSITGRQWRVIALSLALGLIAAANAASIAHAASSTSLFPLIQHDKYVDPQTGISLPDDPALNGG